MKEVNIAELKAHLSAFRAEVRAGGSIIVCDRRTPIARIDPLRTTDPFEIMVPTLSLEEALDGMPVPTRGKPDLLAILRESRDQR